MWDCVWLWLQLYEDYELSIWMRVYVYNVSVFCVWVHVHMQICVGEHVYMNIATRMSMQAWGICESVYAYKHVWVCVCMSICTCGWVCMCRHEVCGCEVAYIWYVYVSTCMSVGTIMSVQVWGVYDELRISVCVCVHCVWICVWMWMHTLYIDAGVWVCMCALCVWMSVYVCIVCSVVMWVWRNTRVNVQVYGWEVSV